MPRHVNHVKLVPSNDIIVHHFVNPVRLDGMQIILAIKNVFSVNQVITSRIEELVSVWNVLLVNTNQTLDNLHV